MTKLTMTCRRYLVPIQRETHETILPDTSKEEEVAHQYKQFLSNSSWTVASSPRIFNEEVTQERSGEPGRRAGR